MEVRYVENAAAPTDGAKNCGICAEPGGRGAWLRNLRLQAAPGSPAHYFNTVHFKDNQRRQQTERGVRQFQLQGRIVAFCGDGGNDCGALRTADVEKNINFDKFCLIFVVFEPNFDFGTVLTPRLELLSLTPKRH